jgi:hypothetical protein
MILFGQVGPQVLSDGTNAPVRQGKLGDGIVSELHGRFYEQTYRGNVYSNGCTATALTANTITLTASTTPILGVWNPASSPVNLAILQASLSVFPNNLTSGAGPGTFVWAVSLANQLITTGTAPYNRKSLAQAGSQAKGMSFVALTGLTNNLVIMEGADFTTPSGLTYTTIVSTQVMPGNGGVQDFEGGLIVPPGGVLALLNTTSSTTWSVSGRLTWEEVPT